MLKDKLHFLVVPLQGCQIGHWVWQNSQLSQSRMVQTPCPCGRVLVYEGQSLDSRKRSAQPGEPPSEKQQRRRWWGCSCGPSGYCHQYGYPIRLQYSDTMVNTSANTLATGVTEWHILHNIPEEMFVCKTIMLDFSLLRFSHTKHLHASQLLSNSLN